MEVKLICYVDGWRYGSDAIRFLHVRQPSGSCPGIYGFRRGLPLTRRIMDVERLPCELQLGSSDRLGTIPASLSSDYGASCVRMQETRSRRSHDEMVRPCQVRPREEKQSIDEAGIAPRSHSKQIVPSKLLLCYIAGGRRSRLRQLIRQVTALPGMDDTRLPCGPISHPPVPNRIMNIAVSADEHFPLVNAVLNELDERGHKTQYIGPQRGEPAQDWPIVTKQAAQLVRSGAASQAVVLCWTGTGCSIVANKIPGIRAALCFDAETARGARRWNDANVLALSMRATSEAVLTEILDSWFTAKPETTNWNKVQLQRLAAMDSNRPARQ